MPTTVKLHENDSDLHHSFPACLGSMGASTRCAEGIIINAPHNQFGAASNSLTNKDIIIINSIATHRLKCINFDDTGLPTLPSALDLLACHCTKENNRGSHSEELRTTSAVAEWRSGL